MRGTTVRLRTLTIAVALAAVLTACASDDGEESVPENRVAQPQDGDASWSATSVLGVEISVPEDWKKVGPISPGDGAEMYTFQTPVNSFGTRGGVQLLTLPTLKRPAEDLVSNITSEARATAGATEITTEQVEWPGATDAWFVTFVAAVPREGETAPHPTEVLVLDLPDGGQTQVTVTALDEDFESQQLHEILQTVTISGGAGGTES